MALPVCCLPSLRLWASWLALASPARSSCFCCSASCKFPALPPMPLMRITRAEWSSTVSWPAPEAIIGEPLLHPIPLYSIFLPTPATATAMQPPLFFIPLITSSGIRGRFYLRVLWRHTCGGFLIFAIRVLFRCSRRIIIRSIARACCQECS